MGDTSNLKFFLNIASYIGKFPYRITSKKFWVFYVGCWCLFSVSLTTAAVMFEITYRDQYYFHILPIIVYVQWTVLNALCSYYAINHVEKWQNILSAFSKYDDIRPNVSETSYKSRYMFIVSVVAVNVSYLIDSYEFNEWLNLKVSATVSWILHMNTINVIRAVILETLTLLINRYKEIREEVSMWHQSPMVSNDRLKTLLKRYKILYEISSSVNEIFGKIMLILFTNTFFITIDMVGITLTVKVATSATVKFASHGGMMVAGALYILSYYDSMEKIGNEIVKLCCIHQAFNGVPTINVAMCIDKLSPRFTADGYFPLNKTALPGLLAGIATYVVVLLQLKPN